ncbi:hypothetical protein CAJAP_00392 [Camponotus japonicus]
MTHYNKFVTVELKKMLQERGLYTGGNKEVLISRLKNHNEQIKRNEILEERARLADDRLEELRRGRTG